MRDFEFVITAPEDFAKIITYENLARQTHGVLIEMFMSAKKNIVIASPYLKDLQTVNPHLNRAFMNAIRKGIQIDILSTKAAFEDSRIRQNKNGGVNLYVPATNFENERELGSHSKFCIVDGTSVYLGSANFTFSGLNKHFEMGVFSNGILAKQVDTFWRYLIDKEYLVRV